MHGCHKDLCLIFGSFVYLSSTIGRIRGRNRKMCVYSFAQGTKPAFHVQHNSDPSSQFTLVLHKFLYKVEHKGKTAKKNNILIWEWGAQQPYAGRYMQHQINSTPLFYSTNYKALFIYLYTSKSYKNRHLFLVFTYGLKISLVLKLL